MNLNEIANGNVVAVNPNIKVTLKLSTGSTTDDTGFRTPTYDVFENVWIQEQALAFSDMQKMDGLNIQGVRRKFYLNGNWNSLVRPDRQGGDIIVKQNGEVWLIAHVLEHFADWTSVAGTRQNDAP